MRRVASAGVYRKIIFTLFFLLMCGAVSFARGKQEEEIPEPQNTEFILCITAFDVSELPPSQRVLGSVMQRELVGDFNRIHHRIRGDEERSRYEELAMITATRQTAASLSAKRKERDALLYQGLANWKYKKELRRLDEEIEVLDTAYKKAAETRPLIAGRPLFKISELNTGGNFPIPPGRGGEEAFLKTNNADAFLAGTFRLVYGRVYTEFRLFTRGASFIYEDDTIFSQENLNAATDELKSRFLAALVNAEPARVTVSAEPPNARIELNGLAVQSGEVVELPPGPLTVRASADDHQSETRELFLEGGETEDVAFVLNPFTMETLSIALPTPGASVYMGAEYLGGGEKKSTDTDTGETAPDAEEVTDAEIPAESGETETAAEAPPPEEEPVPEEAAGSVEEPVSGEALAVAETPVQENAPSAVVSGTAAESGETVTETPVEAERSLAEETAPAAEEVTDAATPAEIGETEAAAETTPGFFSIYVPMGQYRYIRVETEDGLTGEAIVKGTEEDEVRIIALEPRRLPGKDDMPVEEKRKKFYGAYGRFWVALPAAFLFNGFSQLYTNSYNVSGNQSLYKDAKNLYYISIGAWIAAGVFLVETLIRMGIYVHAASEEAVPLVE